LILVAYGAEALKWIDGVESDVWYAFLVLQTSAFGAAAASWRQGWSKVVLGASVVVAIAMALTLVSAGDGDIQPATESVSEVQPE